MRTAVISGIAGQDGALLAAFLLKKNYHVIGLLPEGRESDLSRLDYLRIRNEVELLRLDLVATDGLLNFLRGHQIDEFYNLAAISSVGYSFQHPRETFDFNSRSVMNILECLRIVTPSTRFYQASSSEMFGSVGEDRLPIKESFLFHPVSPYGISKAAAHWLTVNYREAYRLKSCCGILFNHESALRPDHFVIKKIIQTAIRIKEGKERKLQLGNLSIIRDWGYAPRYIEAMWLMMQQEKLDDYLICSGVPTRLKDFVSLVFSNLGLEAEKYVTTDNSLLRSLELETIYGDNTKAKKDLGWEYDIDAKALVSLLIQDEYEMMRWKLSNRAAL